MIAFPNAKINIGLNVIARRPDGYHDLETVFYPIKINDVLEVVEADKLSFESSGLEIPGRPEDNLCIKGYHLLKKDHDLPPVKIHLHKNIPIGAGLGGGSADAGFFIKLMNDNFGLGLSDDSMEEYARILGADCAFFIRNKPVFAFEKGDEFEPINLDLSAYSIVLVMPDEHISTAEAYRGVKAAPVKETLYDLIKTPLTAWRGHIKNDFEGHIFRDHPAIRGIKAELYEHGALYASMSGSGASVFGIFEDTPNLEVMEEFSQVFYNV
ncbi:4-(cytidine 5'-diphospho)-2-C-methyl-D-erythritol kinase [Mucilaginibacter phyllosphaerae]|uniref:4-diphosphocytidyl-2-C-methyl-D-erythritol kinase n=1 Tax=Mucilaginibacter phyllosphaerae TaxID=1812349 RepID=A0A4Y8A8P7_9SPHI|nr:4-(cytidine 5'-diphospho)-2-C-methyl-D-erythritol kinase [Mucilaginibacter phyllosphaerae]MBB3970637.1 4-diphosphocytidyl-2-C-methyl-D-erythritol kinase [Mucilaginibacter phyllosphaerae]TEW64740.1 4-(cytidine 5'-diphospho)-2-C-methyl-D-erythritol kinase [Mucilaginibacter phyllosphaerae]GGH19984.1 4-diphosphocytidyl-2-C-methyl-D-erythritol kinase [Mucilaginibacter phyllosphaerae]